MLFLDVQCLPLSSHSPCHPERIAYLPPRVYASGHPPTLEQHSTHASRTLPTLVILNEVKNHCAYVLDL